MKTFIIHVSTAIEREKHINKQIDKYNLDAEFILDGDIKDLDSEKASVYFGDKLSINLCAVTSCAYKHFLAYEKIVEQNLPYALILEDDIILENGFKSLINSIIHEIKERNLSSFMISIEDSYVRYVKRSERNRHDFLYKTTKGRLAGAYIVDYSYAQNILNYTKKNKCDNPIDWYHNYCCSLGLFSIYWSHSTAAYQGSLSGETRSLIDGKSSGFIRFCLFHAQRYYKRLLYLAR